MKIRFLTTPKFWKNFTTKRHVTVTENLQKMVLCVENLLCILARGYDNLLILASNSCAKKYKFVDFPYTDIQNSSCSEYLDSYWALPSTLHAFFQLPLSKMLYIIKPAETAVAFSGAFEGDWAKFLRRHVFKLKEVLSLLH